MPAESVFAAMSPMALALEPVERDKSWIESSLTVCLRESRTEYGVFFDPLQSAGETVQLPAFI
jgi:hypothetical protein